MHYKIDMNVLRDRQEQVEREKHEWAERERDMNVLRQRGRGMNELR